MFWVRIIIIVIDFFYLGGDLFVAAQMSTILYDHWATVHRETVLWGTLVHSYDLRQVPIHCHIARLPTHCNDYVHKKVSWELWPSLLRRANALTTGSPVVDTLEFGKYNQ